MFEDNIYEEDLTGVGDDDDLLNQPIEDEELADGEAGDAAAGAGQKLEVKIKKKRNIIRPIDRFMGDRGLQSIGDYYKGVKYKGKGHEAEDINAIMNRMQHWAHRAFPQMKFDDALTIIEGLTKKRIVQTHMTKYRMDMLQPTVSHTDGDEDHAQEGDLTGVQPIDEFDDLLGDQIEQMERVQQKKHSTALNNTSMMNQSDMSLGVSAIPTTPQPPERRSAALTSEQMAKIAENRLKALERLKQKQLDAQKAAEESMEDGDVDKETNESLVSENTDA